MRAPAPPSARLAPCLVSGLFAGALLAGCPDLPDSTVGDTTVADGETFVPLSLTRVYENVGAPEGGERVAIFGTGFVPGATVVFGDVAGDNVLVLDDGQLNVTVPTQAAGLVDVVVNLPDGQSATLDDGYLYRGPLELVSIEPTVSAIAGGVEVVVRGKGFTKGTRVLVGGRLLEGAERLDDETIRGRVPARLRAEAGPVDVIATNGFEQRILTRGFEYLRPLDIEGIDPVAGPAAGGTTVWLRGGGFDEDVAVFFGDVPAEIVTVEPGGVVIEVRAPPGRHGIVDVSATRGLEAATLRQAWFYVDPDNVDGGALWTGHAVPPTGPVAGGNLVMISAVGLVGTGGVTARFGSVPADVVDVSPERSLVVVRAPATERDPPAQVDLVIGQHGVEAGAIPYLYDEALSVSAVAPDFTSTDGGTVNLVGEGLSREAVVTVGGKPATVKGLDDGRLTIAVPGGSPGRVDVEVVIGARRVRVPGGLEYRSAVSEMWAVDPGEGAQAGGRIMRLFGEGFRQAMPEPRFTAGAGAEDALELELVDDHLVVFRLPRGDEGNVNVKASGYGTLAMALRYFDPARRYGGTSGGTIPEALNVSVVDYVTGKGVPNAFVILWDDLDTPYQGLTDDRGQITFSDIAFGPNQMVTAGADNHTTATVCDFDARDVTLRLISLQPAQPGGGGGGGGPQPLPDSTLEGRVTGIDKYIVAEPGSCEARLVKNPDDILCQPCNSDAECGGGEDRCTPLGDQGSRCTTACESDVDCPAGYACAGVSFGQVQCIPDAGRRSARCQTTVPDVFTAVTVPLTPTDADARYRITTQPGEYAVVCLGGWEDSVSGEFVPSVMGVRRHVFAQSETVVADQDIELDIPLARDLRIRLDGAPVGRRETELHTVQVFVNLGSDGVFLMPSEGRGIDQNVFELERFPVEFAESLYDASFTVWATAIADAPPESQTGEGSFVHHDRITRVYSDAVFELDFEAPVEGSAAQHRRTGIAESVRAVHGPGAPGALPERLWAVGDSGHVIAWDGTFWAIQQTPTENRLNGVWAAAADDVWAVGDRATIVRWDGLRWLPVPMPADLSVATLDWWGVEGDGAGGLWLWGSHGVWRRTLATGEAGEVVSVTAIGAELTPGSVEDVFMSRPDEAWLVGKGGLIRRWRASAPTQLERWDVAGADLHAVHGAQADRVWAVGEEGRVLRWDGVVWFELLPQTARGLWDVFATGPDEAWAVGDAGEVHVWDGTRWTLEETIEHADLRGIRKTAGGKLFTAGLATLVIGPFMQMPRPSNPTVTGALLDLRLRWLTDPGYDAALNWLEMKHPSGFPFWRIFANGPRKDVPLPDLTAAWGLQPLWPGENMLEVWRVYVPDFDMGSWDETILSPYRWRSWAVRAIALSIPEPAQ
ncbi:MAG: IPT/TIG domain-containing protein [Deltaproteobacteria bacterium]|nr:IPT/TIG domain-containing protein [Deltaproteobacteria bacterium]